MSEIAAASPALLEGPEPTKPWLVNEPAERALIGAVMIRGTEVLDECSLDPDFFAVPVNRAIWSAFLRLHADGVAIDPVTLLDDVATDRDVIEFARARGCTPLTYLTGLETPSSANATDHAAIVATCALTRRTLVKLASLMIRGQNGALVGDELVAEAQRVVGALVDLTPSEAKPLGDLARIVGAELHAAAQSRERGERPVSGISTGYPELDGILGGIPRGVVSILGARPSMGKSAIARSISSFVAQSGQGGVHVFSLEDDAKSYAKRALADEARVNLSHLHTYDFEGRDLADLVAAADRLAPIRNVLVDAKAAISSQEIGARIRRHKRENQTALVVVDYVQLIREPHVSKGDKHAAVTLAADALQQIAREENVAMLLLSQLSRKCEERDDKRPISSDLRESGELEQVANIVAFLYRDEVYNPRTTKSPGIGEVIVRKNKHGGLGTARLVWDGPTATYRNYDEPGSTYERPPYWPDTMPWPPTGRTA